MHQSVQTRVHRILRKLESFRDWVEWHHIPQSRHLECPLMDEERLLGVYENKPGEPQDLLLVTNRSIHWWQGQSWKSLKYSEMAATIWPTDDKDKANVVMVQMKSGAKENIPILGGSEVVKESFEMMRFLDRVIEESAR